MQIVFDVLADGSIKETLRPRMSSLKGLQDFINNEAQNLILKYGADVRINRRIEYR